MKLLFVGDCGAECGRKCGIISAKRFFQLYCHFLGAKIKGEHESHLGRADAVLELPNGVYLFEFKYAKSSAEALAQIHERGYADAYRDDPRPVWLIGCNYNPETRNLDKPAMEALGHLRKGLKV